MNLTIIKQNGGAYIDSREVAEAIGKRHDHLLRDIDGYLRILKKRVALNFGDTSFFVKSTYIDAWNRVKPRYLISKMGCEICANKLTGEKGVIFTALYVAKFNAMEAAEREAEIKSRSKPRLSEFNGAVKNVLNGMAQCYTPPKQVMNFLSGVYEPLGIEVMDETSNIDGTEYYSATAIAEMFDIYSRSGRPHAHAVSAIISKFDNWAGHAIAVPYGLVGVTIRYDWSVVNAIRNWLSDNNYLSTVPYLNFEYHIFAKKTVDFFTEEELNEMCGDYDECELCPGRIVCSGG